MLAYFFDQPVHALHLGRNAYQTRESRLGAKLLAKYSIFLIHLKQSYHPIELAPQLWDVERLRHVVRSAHALSLDGAFNRAVLRQDHHRRLRISLLHAFEQFNPAQLRHPQVRDHNIYSRLIENIQRLLGRRRQFRAQSRFAHNIPAKVPRCILIVHDQNRDRHRSLDFETRPCPTSHWLVPFLPVTSALPMHNAYHLGTLAEMLKAKVLGGKGIGYDTQSSVDLGLLTSRNTTESR